MTGSIRQPGSGSGAILKEDLLNKNDVQQVKSTRKRSISVKLVDLELLVQYARKLRRWNGEEKDPVMILHFVGSEATLAPRAWALIPLEKYLKYDK